MKTYSKMLFFVNADKVFEQMVANQKNAMVYKLFIVATPKLFLKFT